MEPVKKQGLSEKQVKIRRRRNIGLLVAAAGLLAIGYQFLQQGQFQPNALIGWTVIAVIYSAVEHNTLAHSLRRSRDT